MFRGILNIILGLVMVAGAASGNLVLRGTDSSMGLGLVGVAVTGMGVYRLISARSKPV